MRIFYKLMLMSLLFVSCVYVNKQNKEELYASTQKVKWLNEFLLNLQYGIWQRYRL